MKWYDSLVQRFRHASFSRRMFLLSSLVTVLVLLGSSLAIVVLLSAGLESEIARSGENLLAQVKIFSDTYLLGRIGAIISEYFMGGGNDVAASFFFASADPQPLEYLAIYQALNALEVNSGFIHSIQFYRQDGDTLISSREGLVLSALTRPNRQVAGVDRGLIAQSLSSADRQRWISPSENRAFWKQTPVITVVQAIPIYPTDRGTSGLVMLNIDEGRFFRAFTTQAGPAPGEFLIADGKGRIFAHSDSAGLFAPPERYPFLARVAAEDHGFLLARVDGRDVGVTWIRSSINDWRYVSVTPLQVLHRSLRRARLWSAVIVAAAAAAGLLGARTFAQRLARPVGALVATIAGRFGMRTPDTDLRFLDTFIADLRIRMDEVERTIAVNEGLIAHRLVTGLLDGTLVDRESLRSGLALTGRRPDGDRWAVVVTEIDGRLLADLTPKQGEYLRIKLAQVIDESLKDSYCALSVAVSRDTVVTLLNFARRDDWLPHAAGLLTQRIRPTLSSYNLAFADAVADPFDLPSAWREARSLLPYRFLLGYGATLTRASIRELENRSCNLTLEALKDLEVRFRALRFDEVKVELARLVTGIRAGGCSLAALQSFLLQVSELAAAAALKLGLAIPDFSEGEVATRVAAFVSLDDWQRWINGILDLLSTATVQMDESLNRRFMEGVLAFIDDRLDAEFSQATVCDRFGVSAGHLSRVFKAHTGVPFVDYVAARRLDLASRLLRQDPSMKVADIARRVGYRDVSYFIRLFRARFGMTPSQHRKRAHEST